MSARRRWSDEDEGRGPRVSAEAAARRAGLSLGEWLDEIIEDAAAEAERRGRRQRGRDPRRAERDGEIEGVFELLERLARRVGAAEEEARAALELAERRMTRDPAGARDLREVERRLEAAQADLFAAEENARRGLREAAARVRSAEQDSTDPRFDVVASAIGGIERRLEEMARRLEDHTRPVAPPPQAPAPQDVELFDSVRQRLDALARRIEQPAPDPRIDTTLRTLDGRIAELGARLESAMRTPPASPALAEARLARIEESLEGRIAELGARLEAAVRAPAAPAAPAEARLARIEETIEGRIAELGARLEAALGASPAPPASADETRLARIEDALGLLSTRLSRPEPAPAAESGAPPRADAAYAYLDPPPLAPPASPEQPYAEAAPAVEGEAVTPDALDWRREAPASEIDLSDVIRQITERQRALEEAAALEPGPAPEAASEGGVSLLRAQVRELAARLDGARPAPVGPSDMDHLHGKLVELHRMIERSVSSTSLAAVVDEIRAVGDKVLALRQEIGGGPELGRVEAEIRLMRRAIEDAAPREAFGAIEDRIAQLARGLSAAGMAGVDAGQLRRLGDQVDEIRDLAASAMPAESLHAIVGELRRIDGKLDELRPSEDVRAVEGLRREIGDLRAQLSGAAPGAVAAGPDLAGIEAQIHALAAKMDAAQRRPAEEGQLAQLEAQIARLSDMLGDTARQAAREAVDALGPQAAVTDPAVQTLRANLDELREISDANGRRAQETLAAVNETLRQVVQRLNAAEPAAPPPSAPEPGRRGPPAAVPPNAPRDVRAAVAAARDAAARAAELTVEPEPPLSVDRPLEPGSGRPRVFTAADAVRVARDQLRAEPAAPAGPGGDVRRSFIAAARRAAQSAASDVRARFTPEPRSAPAEGAEASPRRRFLPAVQRGHVVLAMAAVVIVLGAVQLAGFLRSGPPAEVETAAAPPPAAVATAPAEQPAARREPTFAPQAAPPRDTTTFASAAAAAPAPPPFPDAIAAPRLRAAVEAGDPRALYETGVRLADGLGLPRDGARAALFFRSAGERNHAPSLYRLANMLEKGQGLTRDVNEAIALYARAAELGNRKAMHNLAALYAGGAAGRPDYERAFPLFQRAAELGLVDSQYNLAVLFVNGLGAPQSPAQAYTWFAIAAQNGDREAERKRDEIVPRLDGQALVNARVAAQSFRPRQMDAAANEETTPPGTWEEAAPARTSQAPARPNLGIAVGAAANSI